MAACLGLAWGAPIMAEMIGEIDFPFHIAAAESFAATGAITMPHFLLQVVLGGILSTGLFEAPRAALAFFAALYALTAAAICWYVSRGSGTARGWAAGAVLAVAVLAAAPLMPESELDLYLIGYFPPNAYHNPTTLVAKPLLVLTLAAAAHALARNGRPGIGELVLLALPVVLLGFAKPNYLGCLLPVLGVAFVWKGTAHSTGSRVRIATMCAAAVLTLAATFSMYRAEEFGFRTALTFAPLAVIGHYSPVDAGAITRSLLGSFAFPLAVTALWPRAVWRAGDLGFAWAAAVVGVLISYLVAEAGARMFDGNFLWTGQMAAFVLFVAAARFVRARFDQSPPAVWDVARALGAAAVLALPVQAGYRHALVSVPRSAWLAFWTAG